MTEGERACVRYVGNKSQKEEERAEDIYAFRDPRDRFDVKRMDCEKRSDESADQNTGSPAGTGGVTKEKEKQNRGDRVKQNICEMMTTSFEIEELTIDHV